MDIEEMKSELQAKADKYNTSNYIEDRGPLDPRFKLDDSATQQAIKQQKLGHFPARTLCNAFVDPLHMGAFVVTIIGVPPHDQKRIYAIVADSDNDAAMEGIRRFVEEMQQT